MKISPINHQMFEAKFNYDDPETKEILKSSVRSDDASAPRLYAVIKTLDNMKSEDTFSLRRNSEEDACSIINDRTGASIDFKTDLLNKGDSSNSDPFYCLPVFLWLNFKTHLSALFEDTSYKNKKGPKFELNDYWNRMPDEYNKEAGNEEIINKINSLRSKLDNYESNQAKIKELEQIKHKNECDYVLSLIG